MTGWQDYSLKDGYGCKGGYSDCGAKGMWGDYDSRGGYGANGGGRMFYGSRPLLSAAYERIDEAMAEQFAWRRAAAALGPPEPTVFVAPAVPPGTWAPSQPAPADGGSLVTSLASGLSHVVASAGATLVVAATNVFGVAATRALSGASSLLAPGLAVAPAAPAPPPAGGQAVPTLLGRIFGTTPPPPAEHPPPEAGNQASFIRALTEQVAALKAAQSAARPPSGAGGRPRWAGGVAAGGRVAAPRHPTVPGRR